MNFPVWAQVLSIGLIFFIILFGLRRISESSGQALGQRLREKFLDSLAEFAAVGVLMLVGYGILQAFIGDYKLEKAKESITSSLVEKSNKAVAREGELVEQVSILTAIVHEQDKQLIELKEFMKRAPSLPPPLPVAIPLPPPGPVGSGAPPPIYEQRIDVQQNNLKRFEDAGAKNRLDFVQKHSENIRKE